MQMIESCPARVQKSFGLRDQESPKSQVCLGKRGLRPCNPMLRQCSKPFAPMSAKTSCAFSRALRARSADVPGDVGNLLLRNAFLRSRLSFLLQNPRTPEGFLKGLPKSL